MTIWILAVSLVASLAALGYRQGAIRVAFSLVGILAGAMLAVPLASLLRPVLSIIGMKQPVILWLAPPAIVFALVLTAVKIVGLNIHLKVENHYKYKVRDIQQIYWERLNRRLGLCLGVVNAMAYLVLISFVLFAGSYWTVQLAVSDSDPGWVRLLNRMGNDLTQTGMAGVGWVADRLPASYYDAADVAGLIYQNPEIEDRLYRYPGLLATVEQPPLQDLHNDASFRQTWQKQTSVFELIRYPAVQSWWNNPDFLRSVWSAAQPDLRDLEQFLASGISQKYEEPLLGRWNFDLGGSVNLLRRSKPNLSAKEFAQARNAMAAACAKASLVVMPNQQFLLKNFVRIGQSAAAGSRTGEGHWATAGGRYQLSIDSGGKAEEISAEIKNGRLLFGYSEMQLAFVREE